MKSIVAWLMLAVAGTAAAGSPDAADWLMRINDAARQVNYAGTFVYVQENRIETMRVTHRTDNGTMRQRIYSLNGARREVIRDSEKVWCYAPDKKVGVYEYRQTPEQGFPNLLPPALGHLTNYYNVYTGAESRMADRPAQQIMVLPKDEFRYGYDLWADKETGLLLKAALLDQEQRTIEQYLFTQVAIGGTIEPKELEPATPKSDLVWYGDAQNQTGGGASDMPTGNWDVKDVPEGFVLTRKIRRLSPMRANILEHYVYSDGLATVSVFVEKMDEKSKVRVRGINKMGAVHAFGRGVDGYQIIVVGEVPAQTVDSIGMSISRKQE